ncbi:hypothetical protein WJX75_001828 [Coccomyxa subellipsoidea]|uniref:Uncharacterized protein n=1 Tax=Coccomyxa subellipsoidea TaxID=248742 RepID=A0ABR2YLY6_9CHLO
MDNVLIFLLVALLCGLQVAASDPDKASGRDDAIVTETLQPPFKTLSKTDAYEERAYEAGDYVATNVTGLPFTIAYTNGLSRLYAYFLGRNEDNVRMSRT